MSHMCMHMHMRMHMHICHVWSNMLVEYFFSCSARALRSRTDTFSGCHGSAPPGGCSARPYMISYRSRATLDLPCTSHS